MVNLKNPDDSYWVAGKEMNSFTLREEQAFSAKLLDKFPFILETRLREHGALFVANQPMLSFVAHDDLLITAQNPMSLPAADGLLAQLYEQKKGQFNQPALLASYQHRWLQWVYAGLEPCMLCRDFMQQFDDDATANRISPKRIS